MYGILRCVQGMFLREGKILEKIIKRCQISNSHQRLYLTDCGLTDTVLGHQTSTCEQNNILTNEAKVKHLYLILLIYFAATRN